MSDQRPDPTGSTPPPLDEPIDPTEPESVEADAGEESSVPDEASEAADATGEATADLGPEVADTAESVAPAWATTPVQPDPAATAAALAALSAPVEGYDQYEEVSSGQPPTDDVPPDWEEPAEERNSVLLVGGILIGALIVALGIVFLLFRPFDSGAPVASPSPSPSPIVSPSPSPSVEPTEEASGTVGTPDFQGLSLEDAQAEADDAGLILRVEDVETDEVDPDTVLDQDPAPGIVLEVGSTVRLSVAVAVRTVAVPDLVGLPADEAAAALEDAGLSGEPAEAHDETIPAGTVVSQEPAPDTELAPGSAVSYVVSTGPAPVAVPDLVGLPADEAAAALEDAGLSGEPAEAHDETIPAGTVVSQEPAPDTELAPGSAVSYVVSTGPAPVAVPDLVGLPADEAAAALEDAGLSGEPAEAHDETIPAGTVVSQEPAPDTELAPGSAVSYVVSTGPAPVAVPDLVGLPADEAAAALEDAGLSGEPAEAHDETIPAGTVVSQEPAPDTELAPGSAVSYVVSTGPAPVAVPDLVGLPADEAAAALEDAGLSGEPAEAHDETIPAGTVVSQEPAPDTELAPGSAVSYVVSTGPAPVAVPDLVGLPADEAAAALEDAGLSGEPAEAHDETIPAGTVVSQEPAPDTELAPGSAVSYVVSTGPAPVAVPDLVGLPADEAAAALEDAGLSGEPAEAHDETIPAGTVVSQEPAPDTELAPGSAVSYVVSTGPAPVAVPDLVGLPADEAAAALEDAGLSGEPAEAHDETIPAGTVVSQEPAPDTELAPGSAVSYVVSTGPAPVAVPDLVGLPADEAAAALEDAGLSGEPAEAHDETIPAGTVVSQEPAPDTELAPGSAVSYVVSTGPAPVAVPDLVGLPADEAAAALEDAGLSGEPAEAHDETIPAGTVVSQEPAPDTELAPGSAVSYVVSTGPAPVAVPDLVGLPADEAAAALEDAGLSGEPAEAHDETIPAGTVVSQEPAPDTELAPGSAVSYVVSTGPAPVAVPDLVGLPADEAAAALEDAGLSGEPAEAHDETIPAGTVVSQEPAPDTELAPGSAVSYVVSTGPAPVAVPDLVGLPADEAAAALEDAGLSGEPAEAHDETIPAGTVVSQEPAPDTELAPGSAVSYVVSTGPAPVAVPDLVGLPADEAAAALEDAGLSGEPAEAHDETIPAGTVVSQEPAPDTELAPGSAVSYVVSTGPAPVAVPDLVGLPADEAAAALEDAGLSGEPAEAHDETIPAGTVVSQEPAPDTELAPGSAVSYVVSTGPAPVAVPDLVGLPADEAAAALEDAGLSGEPAEAHDETIPAGTVVSQEPAPDTELAPGSAVSYVVSTGPAPVAVPDLVGLPADEAAAALEDAGLSGEPAEAHDETIPAGTVVSQEPAPDTELAPGSAVSYVVSTGPAPVAVPDLVGLPADEAAAALEDAGLSGEPAEAHDETIPAGTVVSQEPAPDTELAPGSAVSYVVSTGPAPVAVPDLVGLPADEAAAALEDAGLSGEPAEAHDETIPAGTVVSQEPAPDTELAPGSAVSYVVSTGPAPVAVPDLVGLPADEAAAALEDAGLSGEPAEAHDETIPAGTVVSQEPAPDTELAPGSAVSYVVSTGPAPVAVPDLVGLPADEAAAALEDAGLSGEPAEAHDETIPAGTVVSQEPAPDTELAPGSAVSYVVSTGPAPVAVPDLVGLPADEAAAALQAAFLQLGETASVMDPAPVGEVIAQDPVAGSQLIPGSPVDVTVSLGDQPVEIPDVRDLPQADAVAALEALDLVVAATETRSNPNIAAGNALRTDPEAGTTVDVGSDVTLIVSSGPRLAALPELVGLSRGEARDALASAGLVEGDVSRHEDSSPRDTVLTQDPPAGTEVPEGSPIDLVLSAGPAQVEMPEVRDLPEADAVAALDDAGLVVAATETRPNDNVAAGNALRTDPEAGTTVDVGSDVTLIVSSGPAPVAVPDVVGSSRAAARDALDSAGLVEGDTSRIEDSSVPDTVVSQEPAPDTEVARGSAVDLVLSSGPARVTVPDVRDLPEADAVSALEAAGLVVADTQTRANDGIAAGNALRTDPEAGSEVDPGSEVTLFVSSGSAPVAVPNLVGLSRGEARDALDTAGLVEGDTNRVEDPSPADTVVSQDPGPDTEVAEGSAVDVVLSSGPGQVEVPQVRDLPEADAVATLEAAGLVVGATETRANDNIAAGNALKTEPDAGTPVDPGTEVTLFVSSGSAPVAVPNLVGLSRGEARDALEAAGLVEGDTNRVEDPNPADTVVSQDPGPDSEVAEGSAVDVVLSSGPGQVEVPQVRDLPEADAVATLEAAGLVVGATETRANDNIAAGNALKTEPDAGTPVDPGTEVTLFVSSGSEPVVVPNLVGLPEADGRATLEAAGLVAGVRTEVVDETVPAGSIVSQDPAPDTEVGRGSAVDYAVSSGVPIPSFGEGGTLENATVASQLDAVAFSASDVRELPLGGMPYDAASSNEQRALLAARSNLLHDPDPRGEERTLKRLGLLPSNANLGVLLAQLYGQLAPVAYVEGEDRLSVRDSVDELSASQRATAARELGRATTDQAFGIDTIRPDPSESDGALAAVALEEGDGTAVMLGWIDSNLSGMGRANAQAQVVPGDPDVLASMPPILVREYELPYLDGRAFVDALRQDGGWDAVNGAWSDPPRSTEQILHSGRYPADAPVDIPLDGVAARLGDGWSQQWRQSMGEARIGVWLANGAPGSRSDAVDPADWPRAGAAEGWGGDQLVSLVGPGESWAIVWQTEWDSADDASQFASAATDVLSGLTGAHAVEPVDVAGGLSAPVLVLVTSDPDALAAAEAAYGIAAG